MRGQAFLTFPSIELAHHALICISLYIVIKPDMHTRDTYLIFIDIFYFHFFSPACSMYSVSYII